MDAERFDQWTRSLFTLAPSRRAISRLLAGGALLAHVGREEAEAKCVNPGRKCKFKKKGKTSKRKCCGGAKCQGKKCKCTQGRVACGKKCCPKGQICAGGGRCVAGQGTCPTGADTCGPDEGLCNGNPECFCMQRLQGGTRCVQFKEQTDCANNCVSDADCLGLGFPQGSSCVQAQTCCEEDVSTGACLAPCGLGDSEVAPGPGPSMRGFRQP